MSTLNHLTVSCHAAVLHSADNLISTGETFFSMFFLKKLFLVATKSWSEISSSYLDSGQTASALIWPDRVAT
jgi:hypothetical protein